MHEGEQPSEWVVRWADLVDPRAEVLDVAAGAGRHTRFWLERGNRVVAVDRDLSGLRDLGDHVRLELIEADIEAGPWPLNGRTFGAVVVTNYLHRPLLSQLVDAVGPGGVLIYETFARGNEVFGRPSNPDFLLQPGELLDAVRGSLHVVAYEDMVESTPRPAALQRLCATRPEVP